jgi:hypothetical protein
MIYNCVSLSVDLPGYGLYCDRSHMMVYGAAPAGATENTYGGKITYLQKDSDATEIIGRLRLGYDGVNSDVAVVTHCDAPTGGLGITAAGITARGNLALKTKTPASATAAGIAGTICWDAEWIYICVATNTWKRVAITSWQQ